MTNKKPDLRRIFTCGKCRDEK